ncbi:hypothetical protein PG985_009676 [Apiospora marii]|uniref:Ribosomal protein S19 n=1 Tax=Apiospora marii TaxID=335849 RepID=A0ABR1RFY4_9PEZI
MQPTRCLLKGRSVWKGKYPIPPIPRAPAIGPWKAPEKANNPPARKQDLTFLPIVRPKPGEKIKPIRTQARAATILPSFVGLKFQVHNGKVYNDVVITEDMVGHKLGEFSMTRKPFIWSRK